MIRLVSVGLSAKLARQDLPAFFSWALGSWDSPVGAVIALADNGSSAHILFQKGWENPSPFFALYKPIHPPTRHPHGLAIIFRRSSLSSCGLGSRCMLPGRANLQFGTYYPAGRYELSQYYNYQ